MILSRISSISRSINKRSISFTSKLLNSKDSNSIFEQLKAQQNLNKSFKDEPEMDEKEKERIKRQQGYAEQEIRERQSRTFGIGSITMAVGLVAFYALLGMPDSNDKSSQESDENYLVEHHKRVIKSISDYKDYWTNPTTKKILPDPLPAPYQKPLTLCIELTDSLVHLVWDKSEGWKIALRPGAKELFANLSEFYELVLFTTQQPFLAEPVIAALDPFQYFAYRLYRDHTKMVGSKYIKDISQLNRDIDKVILVDVNPDSYSLQPENGIYLKPWKGETGDQELYKLQTFLHELYLLMTMTGKKEILSLLNVVKKLNNDNPIEGWETYKQVLRDEFNKQHQLLAERSGQSIFGYVFSIFGGRTDSAKKSKNVIDILEKVAAEQKKEISEHREKNKHLFVEMQKQQEDAIRAQMEEMKNKKLKLMDYMMGAGQPSPPGNIQASSN